MIDLAAVRPHCSADVRLRLETAAGSFPLAQIGPGHVLFRDGVELDPCEGVVVMSVEGREKRWKVELTDSVTPIDSAVSPVRVRFFH